MDIGWLSIAFGWPFNVCWFFVRCCWAPGSPMVVVLGARCAQHQTYLITSSGPVVVKLLEHYTMHTLQCDV